jgi:hypothetical protein
MMKKICLNIAFGGFGLSSKAVMRYSELKGITLYERERPFGNDYYLIEPEEYDKIHIEDRKRRCYKKSNELYFSVDDIERDDPILIQVVEELGEESWGRFAELKIVEIPSDTSWQIEEYDGLEHIAECHRRWS